LQVQRPGLWSQISLDLSILAQLLRLLRWAGRIKQDITLWATTLGQGLAQELDYVQVGKWAGGPRGP
jgi:predicted unusual protein kinase regulating ubiquinone biosynthesis (AarF/ABC1/UbiB family)